MASWRPPGSILEAPELDFGGSGDHLSEIFAHFGWVLKLWGSFRYDFRRRCANCCREPRMAFTLAFWFSPCSAAVLAQHIELKSTDPLGSGVWEFILPPSYNPPSTVAQKRKSSLSHPPAPSLHKPSNGRKIVRIAPIWTKI